MGIFDPRSMIPRGWTEETWGATIAEVGGWPKDCSESEGQRWRRKNREQAENEEEAR